jgi:hypothetical protein
MEFHLPRAAGEWENALRSQLRASTRLIKICLIFVGVIFPIGEAVLVNLATSAQAGSRAPYVWSIVIIGSLDLLLFVITKFSEKPLPDFLGEFKEQEDSFH